VLGFGKTIGKSDEKGLVTILRRKERCVAVYGRAAIFLDKILKGAKPADVPSSNRQGFELANNLKAAKQIDLTIPPESAGESG
jgi:hypothetical protein